MRIDGKSYRTIWPGPDGTTAFTFDQTLLPHRLEIIELRTMEDAARAILTMQVRGAPLIGATAAYGMALALRSDPSDANLAVASAHLAKQRPTAINLKWAIEEVRAAVAALAPAARADAAFEAAGKICDDDVEACRRIGEHGASLIREIAERKGPGDRIDILTHCNAGWFACVDWGTATAPIYAAHNAGLPIHVWVDETRPRNQGAALTAFELGKHGVPHTIIADNAGGHLMQHGRVDMCIVGTDRVTANGDVANKIGTYLKALAAADNGIPFYVALPHSTIDWTIADGFHIPIEERSPEEVLRISGRLPSGTIATVEIAPAGSLAANPAFDVTPARLVTGLITERGVCDASRDGLLKLYPERRPATGS